MDTVHTPTCRITRCITILSDSKEWESSAVKEGLRKTSNKKKIGKRPIDLFEEDTLSRKKTTVMQSNPKDSRPKTQNHPFIIDPENRFGGTINVFSKNDVITTLKAKLNKVQKNMFRSTCFGHFLEMNKMRIQHQIIHKMLMLEIRQPNEDEMRFIMDRKILRNDVEQVFKKLPSDTTDEDVVKIGILYLITMYLFTSTQPNVVSNDVICLVDSPYMNFPWGKELFQLTFKNLKNAFKNAETINGDNRVILTYRLYGFPLAFQIWVYESVPSLSRKFCKRIRNSSPRILNWTNNSSRVTVAKLDKFILQLNEVDVVEMHPNELEK